MLIFKNNTLTCSTHALSLSLFVNKKEVKNTRTIIYLPPSGVNEPANPQFLFARILLYVLISVFF